MLSSKSGESCLTKWVFRSFSGLSSMFSSAQNLRLSRTSTWPCSTFAILWRAWGPMTSSTNITSWLQQSASALACGSRFVKSSFPGLLWWDPRTTLASSSLASVSETALILVSSRIRCVDGSSGTLMSTLRKIFLLLVSTSSNVRNLWLDKLGAFSLSPRLVSFPFNLSWANAF